MKPWDDDVPWADHPHAEFMGEGPLSRRYFEYIEVALPKSLRQGRVLSTECTLFCGTKWDLANLPADIIASFSWVHPLELEYQKRKRVPTPDDARSYSEYGYGELMEKMCEDCQRNLVSEYNTCGIVAGPDDNCDEPGLHAIEWRGEDGTGSDFDNMRFDECNGICNAKTSQPCIFARNIPVAQRQYAFIPSKDIPMGRTAVFADIAAAKTLAVAVSEGRKNPPAARVRRVVNGICSKCNMPAITSSILPLEQERMCHTTQCISAIAKKVAIQNANELAKENAKKLAREKATTLVREKATTFAREKAATSGAAQ